MRQDPRGEVERSLRVGEEAGFDLKTDAISRRAG
jgi:hypothetical protein